MNRSHFWRLAAIALTFIVLERAHVQRAQGQSPSKRFITPDGQRPTGLFAPGVMVGQTLYVAGKGDNLPSGDFAAKVNSCLNEIKQTLAQAGLGMEHVVKSFVYLEDPTKYDELNMAYGAFFPHAPPARTTLGVAQVPGDSQVEITCIAYADLTGKKAIGQPPSNRPYSPGILVGDTLYVSGKGDSLPGGDHPATFDEQVRQCLKNVEETLHQAGLDFRHVVMSHVFVDDPKNMATAAKVYGEFFKSGDEPACAAVAVDWIPGGSHVEVTCIATTELARRRVVRSASASAAQLPLPASPAVWAGDTLYVSAQTGDSDPSTTKLTGVAAQVHQLAARQTAVLDTAGLQLADIVSGNVYLADIGDFAAMNSVYREHFSQGPGVRTTLMPARSQAQSTIRISASFIAAKTQPPASTSK